MCEATALASRPTLLSIRMVRLDELRRMLAWHRAAMDARDIPTGEALTDVIDELNAQVTDARIAQDVKVAAWRCSPGVTC